MNVIANILRYPAGLFIVFSGVVLFFQKDENDGTPMKTGWYAALICAILVGISLLFGYGDKPEEFQAFWGVEYFTIVLFYALIVASWMFYSSDFDLISSLGNFLGNFSLILYGLALMGFLKTTIGQYTLMAVLQLSVCAGIPLFLFFALFFSFFF